MLPLLTRQIKRFPSGYPCDPTGEVWASRSSGTTSRLIVDVSTLVNAAIQRGGPWDGRLTRCWWVTMALTTQNWWGKRAVGDKKRTHADHYDGDVGFGAEVAPVV